MSGDNYKMTPLSNHGVIDERTMQRVVMWGGCVPFSPPERVTPRARSPHTATSISP